MIIFIRSLLFNIAFFVYSAIICLAFSWTFILPRKIAFAVIRNVYFRGIGVLERIFLNLNYRVSGHEHLPEHGSYILAMKHYSTYETLKIPVIFNHIAIILKRELTRIPFWGWFTLKLGMIPVDRGKRGQAIASIVKGAKRVMQEERPILIFPQGTRVRADETSKDRPYKIGIARIAENLKLPIVPVAINSGYFWPKHAFLKKSGTVDFKILPPLSPDLPYTELMAQLEKTLEDESNALMAKAAAAEPKRMGWFARTLVWICILMCTLWAAWWYLSAFVMQRQLNDIAENNPAISSPYAPETNGFPFQIHASWRDLTYTPPEGDGPQITTDLLTLDLWPLPGTAGRVSMPNGFNVSGYNFKTDLFHAYFDMPRFIDDQTGWAINFKGIDLNSGETQLQSRGDIILPFDDKKMVQGEHSVVIAGYTAFLDVLRQNKIIDDDKARLTKGFFDAMSTAQGGQKITFPMKIKDDVIYAGFIRLFKIERSNEPALMHQIVQPQQKNHFDDLGINVPLAPAP